MVEVVGLELGDELAEEGVDGVEGLENEGGRWEAGLVEVATWCDQLWEIDIEGVTLHIPVRFFCATLRAWKLPPMTVGTTVMLPSAWG